MQAPLLPASNGAAQRGHVATIGGTATRIPTPTTSPIASPLRRIPTLAPSPEDPYRRIEKRTLHAPDGMKSKGFTVRLEDDRFPSGYREVGVVSQDYLLVENAAVRDLALEIADRSGGAWQLTKEFFDGKRFVYALALRDHSLIDVRLGDPVGLGLMFENSYDGSRRLSASLYVNRLVCTNGMLAPSIFRRVAFRHTDAAKDWDVGIASALRMIDTAGPLLNRFAGAMSKLAALDVTTDELARIREHALPQLPVSLFGKVVDRFLAHEEPTAWGLMNAATQVLWHNPKPTLADMGHNEYVVRALASYVSPGGDFGALGTGRYGGER